MDLDNLEINGEKFNFDNIKKSKQYSEDSEIFLKGFEAISQAKNIIYKQIADSLKKDLIGKYCVISRGSDKPYMYYGKVINIFCDMTYNSFSNCAYPGMDIYYMKDNLKEKSVRVASSWFAPRIRLFNTEDEAKCFVALSKLENG